GGVEETLGREPALQLLEGEPESAEAARLHPLDVELERAPGRVEPDVRLDDDVHPAGGPELEDLGGAAEHDGRELAPVVLQREVEVARGLGPDVRELAADPDRADGVPERALDERRDLRDGQNAGCGAGAKHPRSSEPHPSRRATKVLKTCQLFSSSRAWSSCGSLPSSPSLMFEGTVSLGVCPAPGAAGVDGAVSSPPPVFSFSPLFGCERWRGRLASRRSGPCPGLSAFATSVDCSIWMSGTMPVAWIERPLGVK